MKIRLGVPREAELLSDLAMRAKASRGYPEAWLREWRPQLRFGPADFVEGTVLVAEDEGRILGVVAFTFDTERADGEIQHFWVDPPFHGRGVGRALLAVTLQHARDAGIESVRVESDPGARRFYEDSGAEYEGDIAASVLGVDRTLPVLRFRIRPEPTEESGLGAS